MIVEDFHGSFQNRMDKLNRVLRDKISLIIVGSSFGGLMAAVFACNNQRRIKRLILLAPALTFEEFKPYLAQKIHTPVIVFHGKNDDVILLAAVYEIACSVFENLTFNAVDDDHVLSKTFESLDWDNLLNGVKTR